MVEMEFDAEQLNGLEYFSVIWRIILFVIIVVLNIYLIFWVLSPTIAEYNIYNDFCNERPNFCYCSLWDMGGCEFKTLSYSSTQMTNGVLTNSSSGMSEDTKALCELATKLEDEEMIFKVGC